VPFLELPWQRVPTIGWRLSTEGVACSLARTLWDRYSYVKKLCGGSLYSTHSCIAVD
jgi:hypothetical protein